jgi:hypothetical protein
MDASPPTSTEADLEALRALQADASELERIQNLHDRFNVFETIGFVGQEVVHPRFLAFLLDPKQNHGLGDLCLFASLAMCLDGLMNGEADSIKEIRYLVGLMRQNCQEASWRVDLLLSKLKEEESLDTQITSIQLDEARNELHLIMRGIEGIEKLCELESGDNH